MSVLGVSEIGAGRMVSCCVAGAEAGRGGRQRGRSRLGVGVVESGTAEPLRDDDLPAADG